jgi:hypothetical protein
MAFHANSRFKFLNLMGFLDITIILRILLGFFQVFYVIFRDFFFQACARMSAKQY